MTSIFTLIAFIAGFIIACVLLFLKNQLAKRNRESEIEFLQFERDHRELLRDSKVHRERIARRSIFSALLFLGVVIIITLAIALFPFTTNNPEFPAKAGTQNQTTQSIEFPAKAGIQITQIISYLPFILWTLYLIYVFVLWRRYANINAHQKFLYKIDAKMIKARKRLEGKK